MERVDSLQRGLSLSLLIAHFLCGRTAVILHLGHCRTCFIVLPVLDLSASSFYLRAAPPAHCSDMAHSLTPALLGGHAPAPQGTPAVSGDSGPGERVLLASGGWGQGCRLGPPSAPSGPADNDQAVVSRAEAAGMHWGPAGWGHGESSKSRKGAVPPSRSAEEPRLQQGGDAREFSKQTGVLGARG